jgi:hypothetical protein
MSPFAAFPLAPVAVLDADGDEHPDLVFHERAGFGFLPNATFDSPEYRCRAGAVGAANGDPADVLLVNFGRGLSGGRTLRFARGQSIEVEMFAPPSKPSGPSRFFLAAWAAVPSDATLTPLPAGLGTACLPMPIVGGSPRPGAIWNNFGGEAATRLGAATHPSSPAPSVVFRSASGIGREVTFFLQGIIADAAAPNGRAAVTNGILVEIR